MIAPLLPGVDLEPGHKFFGFGVVGGQIGSDDKDERRAAREHG